MPIKDCPFTLCSGGIYRPILNLRIINPHTNKTYRTYGIIDTGADECAIPASYSILLGHNLRSGKKRIINTGNGKTVAYSHITNFEIFHPITGKHLYTVDNATVDFLPNLKTVLLGVNNFLNNFILTIDYPRNLFSLKIPK